MIDSTVVWTTTTRDFNFGAEEWDDDWEPLDPADFAGIRFIEP